MAQAASTLSRLIVPLGIAAAVVNASIYDVPGGYRAVMFDRFSGVKDKAVDEGTHFLVPWLQRAILYDCRTKPRNISTTTGSKDLQMVSLTLRVLSRPDVQHLSKIYQTLGLDYDERVLPSIGNEVLKAIVAQFDAAELITQREVVSSRIREDLLQRASEFNIQLEDVSITHLTFGKEFTVAVEAKQIAQQDAERAKFIVEKAEQERQAAVIRAEGEAEAAATISKALSKAGDAFITFRKIETSKAIAQSLSGNKNVTYVPSANGNILLNMHQQCSWRRIEIWTECAEGADGVAHIHISMQYSHFVLSSRSRSFSIAARPVVVSLYRQVFNLIQVNMSSLRCSSLVSKDSSENHSKALQNPSAFYPTPPISRNASCETAASVSGPSCQPEQAAWDGLLCHPEVNFVSSMDSSEIYREGLDEHGALVAIAVRDGDCVFALHRHGNDRWKVSQPEPIQNEEADRVCMATKTKGTVEDCCKWYSAHEDHMCCRFKRTSRAGGADFILEKERNFLLLRKEETGVWNLTENTPKTAPKSIKDLDYEELVVFLLLVCHSFMGITARAQHPLQMDQHHQSAKSLQDALPLRTSQLLRDIMVGGNLQYLVHDRSPPLSSSQYIFRQIARHALSSIHGHSGWGIEPLPALLVWNVRTLSVTWFHLIGGGFLLVAFLAAALGRYKLGRMVVGVSFILAMWMTAESLHKMLKVTGDLLFSSESGSSQGDYLTDLIENINVGLEVEAGKAGWRQRGFVQREEGPETRCLCAL